MDLNNSVGKRIYELRKERGYSQDEVAKMLLINRNKYSEIESGKNDITLSLLEKLQTIYDVDLTYLLSIEKTNVNVFSGNFEKLSNQGYNNTLNINIPLELVEEIKKVFKG